MRVLIGALILSGCTVESVGPQHYKPEGNVKLDMVRGMWRWESEEAVCFWWTASGGLWCHWKVTSQFEQKTQKGGGT